MASVSWDGRGEARAALHAIVSDPNYGVAALSSPQVMSSLLKDLLPDEQREAGVLVAAAEAGLANTLAGYRAQGMDLGTATALAMESFAARTAFTADACHWAVSELASAAGFDAGAAGQGKRPPAASARTAPPGGRQRVTTGAVAGPRTGHRREPEGRKRPADGRETSRVALEGWRARRGLLLLIAIPTAALIVLGGIRIASSVQSALAYQRMLQLTTLSSDIAVLAQRLEDERDQTVYYIALGNADGRAAPNADKTAALGVVRRYQHKTDQAVGQVRSQLEEVGGTFPAQTRQEATTALSELSLLGELRGAATDTGLPALDVVRKYTSVIDDLLVLEDATGQGASDATLAQSVRVLGLVSHMKEDASEQRAILTAALIQRTLTNEALSDLTNAQSDQAANLSEFNLTATAAQRQLWNSTSTGPIAYLAPNEEQQAINLQTNNGSLNGDQTHADDWYGAESHIINFQMGAVERDLASQAFARADVLRSNAITEGIIAFLLLIALALLFATVLGAAMTRRLRRHQHAPKDVASLRQPVAGKGQGE